MKMFAAGRIEFLGKHTDYCGGQSIVCAIDRGFRLSVGEHRRGFALFTDERSDETVEIPFGQQFAAEGWANYPSTVLARIARNFGLNDDAGVAVSFLSDMPSASGLSSSSAFITAVFCAVAKHLKLDESPTFRQNIASPTDLAEFLGCVENGSTFRGLDGTAGVGTFGGSQDHAAIVCCKNGRLARFGFAPLAFREDFEMPRDLCFVVASSGVVAQKTGAAMEKYNRLSLMVSSLLEKWPEKGKSLASVIESNGFDSILGFARSNVEGFGRLQLEARLRAFYEENFVIIPKVADLIRAGNWDGVGELVDRSHRNAEMLLGNQTPETVSLQRSAREIGAVAASAFGAGFGGSVYAVVRASDADAFSRDWQNQYFRLFPDRERRASFFTARPSESSGLLSFD